MERGVMPDDRRPVEAVDAYYGIVRTIQSPQEKARRLAAYIDQWGEDEDRSVLLGFVQALGWAEDPVDGDARDATLDREVIAAIAAEVMVRYWQVELLCDTRNRDRAKALASSTRYRLLPQPPNPEAGARERAPMWDQCS